MMGFCYCMSEKSRGGNKINKNGFDGVVKEEEKVV